MVEQQQAFSIKGEGPSGWSITGGEGAFYLCVIVVGSKKAATWVEEALNAAFQAEQEALDRGG